MRIGAAIRNAWEWLPIPILAAIIVLKTEWFSQRIPIELWLLFALILAGNVVWILAHRGIRDLAKFREKYPGFKVNR